MARRKGPKQGTVTEYRGIKYRSKWEVYFAKLLLYSDIRNIYEPKRFFLTKTLSYLPDFYLPDYNVYVEVKGVLSQKDRIILESFSEVENVIYFGKKQLSYIYEKPASKLSKLDIIRYNPSKREVARFKELLFHLIEKEKG